MTHPWEQTININEERAKKLLEHQQNLHVKTIRLLDEGWDNVVYLVNEDLIFRFPRREFGVFCMENEIALLPFIKRHASFALTSPDWIGMPSELYPYRYAGYKMLLGLPVCDAFSNLCDDDQFAITLANWLNELHAIPVQQEHVINIKGDHEWRLNVSHRVQMGKDNITRYDNYFMEAGFKKEQLLEIVELLSQLTFSKGNSSYVHGDLYFRHIIVNSENLLPAGLIDWGDIHIGNPAIDLASGMILTKRAFNIFLNTYGSINEEARAIISFHAFFHATSFLPYAFEQNKENLKRWATLVLARAIEDIHISK